MEKKHLLLVLLLSDITLALVAVLFLVSLLFNTVKTDKTEGEASTIIKVEETVSEPEIEPVLSEEMYYKLMLDASIVDVAEEEAYFYNNYRMKLFLTKLKDPDAVVNIVGLGGSITEGEGAGGDFARDGETVDREKFKWGDGYFYLFERKLRENPEYKATINSIDAGICGTPSSLGCMRFERDVLDKLPADNNHLDMLIIEFAVNDVAEVTARGGYEGIIYRTLKEYPSCAVVLLFSVTSENNNVEDLLIPIGKAYGLPMVSMKAALEEGDNLLAMNENTPGIVKRGDYFFDNLHPADKGHNTMADCLINLLNRIDDDKEIDKELPLSEDAFITRDYAYMKLIGSESQDPNVLMDRGAFTSVDDSVQMIHYPDESGNIFTVKSFPYNFMKPNTETSLEGAQENKEDNSASGEDAGKKDSANKADNKTNVASEDNNKPLVFTFKNCNKVMISYKNSNSQEYGSADFYVDDNYFVSVNGYMPGIENYNRQTVLVNTEEYGDHTIMIKMSEGSENKSFTIYAFAYNGKEEVAEPEGVTEQEGTTTESLDKQETEQTSNTEKQGN